MKKKVVILSDLADVAKTEVSLKVLDNCSSDEPSILTVKAKEFDLDNGQFLLRLLMDSLHDGDSIVVVLDPRFHDTPRETIGVLFKNGVSVFGPNNGVLSWLINDFEVEKVIQLPTNNLSKMHPTFNGKYRYSLAAGKFVSGVSFDDLGTAFPQEKLHTISIRKGTVVHIDNYGNLKIYGDRPNYKKGQMLTVVAKNNTYTVKFGSEFDEVEEGDLIVYPGSSLHGLPELARTRGNAAKYLGISIGDVVTIEPNI